MRENVKALEWRAGEGPGTGRAVAESVFAAPRGLGDDRSPKGIIAEALLCGMLVAAVAGAGGGVGAGEHNKLHSSCRPSKKRSSFLAFF